MAALNPCRPGLGSTILINMGKPGKVFKMVQPKYSFIGSKKLVRFKTFVSQSMGSVSVSSWVILNC